MRASIYQHQTRAAGTLACRIALLVWCVAVAACRDADLPPREYVTRAPSAQITGTGVMVGEHLRGGQSPTALASLNEQSSPPGRKGSAELRLPAPALPGVTDEPWEALQVRLEREPELACKISYKQTAAAIGTRPPAVDTGGFPPLELATPDVFMKDCLKLPRMVQKCQVFQFIMHHHADCLEARGRYDAQLQAAAIERRRAAAVTAIAR